jgi:pyrroloquinoline quinone (PQQ) biosynthesis protein C
MMLASGTAAELLGRDDQETWADPAQHPVWTAVTSGQATPHAVRDLVLALYPVFTGRARYMLAGKVTWLRPDDGKEIFAELHRALTVADADADAGWAAVARALGITDAELAAAAASPPAEAADLVAVAREHGLRSAHEGVGVAWVLDRRLPGLAGQLADALAGHYGVGEEALRHLRFRAGEAGAAQARAERLAERYLQDPWQVYEARRAAREVLWDLTALLESAGRDNRI